MGSSVPFRFPPPRPRSAAPSSPTNDEDLRRPQQQHGRCRLPPDGFPQVSDRTACASAPGKVILFGEHAVVYGEPAVAAALSDLRVRVLATPTPSAASPRGPALLRASLADLGLYAEFDMAALADLKPRLAAPPTTECARAIAESRLLRDFADGRPDGELAVSALTPLLYLVATALPLSSEATTAEGDGGSISFGGGGLDVLILSRSLPVGAGLGSSAAFSTALAAALVRLRSTDGGVAGVAGVPDPASLRDIERLAYYSEQLLHGTPSGIDNAVSAHGGAILFQRAATAEGEASAPPALTRLPANLGLLPPMMLVNTGVPRSTKALVARVREQADRHPGSVRAVLRAMGLIAAEFAAAPREEPHASSAAAGPPGLLFFEQLRRNQDLLRSVGVSHPVIDAICETVSVAGGAAAAAKLTGAGGGGCVLVAFAEDSSSAVQAALRRKFPSLALLRTQVGGPGVRWITPEEVCSLWRTTHPARDGTRPTPSFRWMLAVGSLAAGAALMAVRGFRRRSA